MPAKGPPSGGLAARALLGPSAIRELAERLGVRPSRQLGQNFVVDAGTVTRIAALARLSPADVVLEVGPGFGSLTLALLATGARVVAIEIDPVLAAALPETVGERAPERAGRLSVVTGDAVRITGLPGGGQPSVLVANLPYNVAVPVVLHVLAEFPGLRRCLVMVQAEVADRMAAAPGSRVYGIPSVKLAWYGVVRRVGSVPRSVFWPVPRVDSGLVRVTRHERPPWEPPGGTHGPRVTTTGPDGGAVSREEVFAVVDAAFAQRRKTLRAALAGWAGSAAAAERILRAAGVDPALRGEALGIAEYVRIAGSGTARSTIIGS